MEAMAGGEDYESSMYIVVAGFKLFLAFHTTQSTT